MLSATIRASSYALTSRRALPISSAVSLRWCHSRRLHSQSITGDRKARTPHILGQVPAAGSAAAAAAAAASGASQVQLRCRLGSAPLNSACRQTGMLDVLPCS